MRLKCRFQSHTVASRTLLRPHFRDGFADWNYLIWNYVSGLPSPHAAGRGKRGNEWLHFSLSCLIELDDQVNCLIWDLVNTACLSKRYFNCLTGIDICSLKKRRRKKNERKKDS